MVFRKISLKNFKSYGDEEQTLNLDHTGIRLVSGKNMIGKCVSKNTLIETKEFGIIEIGSLFPEDGLPNDIYLIEDKIHVKTDEGWKLIEGMFITEEQDMYEFELENGKKMKCSGEHRVMTQRGWVFVRDLSNSDEIVCDDAKVKNDK